MTMPSLDETMAERSLHLARPWPDGVPAGHETGLCASCLYPFDGDRLWWNGGFMHTRCAAARERLILGDDAGPGLLEHLDYLDDLDSFLTNLGREAGKLGIDLQRLALAVERASHV
jgi:hypothetical protein